MPTATPARSGRCTLTPNYTNTNGGVSSPVRATFYIVE